MHSALFKALVLKRLLWISMMKCTVLLLTSSNLKHHSRIEIYFKLFLYAIHLFTLLSKKWNNWITIINIFISCCLNIIFLLLLGYVLSRRVPTPLRVLYIPNRFALNPLISRNYWDSINIGRSVDVSPLIQSIQMTTF